MLPTLTPAWLEWRVAPLAIGQEQFARNLTQGPAGRVRRPHRERWRFTSGYPKIG